MLERVEACKGTLKHLCEIASEADDLRAQALYDCCQFDALLELGELFTRTLELVIPAWWPSDALLSPLRRSEQGGGREVGGSSRDLL